jgi:phospholipid-binding lipoprotein MlaA
MRTTFKGHFHKRNIVTGLRLLALGAVCAAGLAGCASAQKAGMDDSAQQEVYDPMENMNRGVFAFNNAVDHAVMRPVAKGYRAVVPKPVRNGLRNFLNNLRSPIVFANQVLQGDVEGAGNAFARAAINTTVGVGGLFDVAGSEGLKDEPEDFGQTLAVWGVDHGPYLVIPLMGPSSLRDGTGMLVDSFADPVRLYLFNTDRERLHYIRVGLSALDQREALLDVMDDLEKNSFDYYAAMRSAYIQRREALVNDQDPATMAAPAIPDYDDDM